MFPKSRNHRHCINPSFTDTQHAVLLLKTNPRGLQLSQSQANVRH